MRKSLEGANFSMFQELVQTQKSLFSGLEVGKEGITEPSVGPLCSAEKGLSGEKSVSRTRNAVSDK